MWMPEDRKWLRLIPLLLILVLFPSAVQSAAPPSDLAGVVSPGGAMLSPRAAHTATPLADNTVLIAGGCTVGSCERGDESATIERFDLATSQSRFAGKLSGPRISHTATLLDDGRVLLAGGWGATDVLATAELYDPNSESIVAIVPMIGPRAAHSATLLADGRVLLAGGSDDHQPLATAELFDPATNTFAAVSPMTERREAHAAAQLGDGRVLVVGGSSDRGSVLASAETFDPATKRFSPTGPLSMARYKLAAAPLPDGRVLIMGGSDERDFAGRLSNAEVFDPIDDTFSETTAMVEGRFKFDQAVASVNTGVLIAGDGPVVELFDPTSASYKMAAGRLDAARMFSTASRLADGGVLILGGYDQNIDLTAKAWIWEPND